MTGTLLGIARDGKHIEGSGDIDIAVAFEDLDKIKDFGNGVAEYWNGIPVYWNYGNDPIINVQALILIKSKRYYISDKYIQYGIGEETCEELLTQWYGDWKTPQKGHAKTKLYDINFSAYSS